MRSGEAVRASQCKQRGMLWHNIINFTLCNYSDDVLRDAYRMLKYTRLFIEVGLFMSPSPGRRREESVYTSGDARIHHHRLERQNCEFSSKMTLIKRLRRYPLSLHGTLATPAAKH